MTLKQLLVFLLQFIFIFVFSACTSSGGVDDEVFQAEEEEYMESQNQQTIVSEDAEDADADDYEESEVLVEDSSDVINSELGDDFSDGLTNENEYDTEGDNLVNIETPKKKTWVPLKKIPTKPWKQDGKWVNAVYIAREGDDLNQISIKIYGQTNLMEKLKSFNPFLKKRDPKVGDKIYYNSPNRPNDRVKFSHYYEDNNQTAMTYDIQSGENIRKIAMSLLGHEDSWKEIWATNPQVESKGNVNETVTVYYWLGSSAKIKDATPAPEPSPEEVLADESEIADVADVDVDTDVENQDISVSEEEPPTLDGGMDTADVSEEEAPQLMPDEASSETQSAVDGEGSLFSKNMNKIKVIAIAGILLILAVFFIRMIRNRKNKADFDFSQTHIDIDNIEE